jgi:hypothetical protein
MFMTLDINVINININTVSHHMPTAISLVFKYSYYVKFNTIIMEWTMTYSRTVEYSNQGINLPILVKILF